MNAATEVAAPTVRYTLWQLVGYMLGLGTWGFGGPVALVGYMYRDLVEKRRWITEGDYREGLALAQLMPGPLAAQLAIYLGFVHYRVLGATLVYGRLLRTAKRPAETFRKIALGVLLVSFLPNLALFMTQAMSGLSLPALLALLAMHVATAAISVRVLTDCPHLR